MRVIAFPKTGISYNDSFYAALGKEGVEVLEGVFSGGWLNSHVRSGDFIHLHWPSFEYSSSGSIFQIFLRFFRFCALLLLARLKGGNIVWTAHNLFPHDRSRIKFLDIVARHFVITISRIILVHGERAGSALISRFPAVREKLVYIPHGNWIGYYPVGIDKPAARSLLGLPLEKPVFLFIGLCKPYKNLHELVITFKKLNLDAFLLIAGKFSDRSYRDKIFSLAGGDARICLVEGFIPDAEMQNYLVACDYVVVPYQEILTSGTAMLALSFGRPLISVDLGFLRDVVQEDVGILFAHDDPQGLEAAMLSTRERQFSEEVILRHAEKYSFSDAAKKFINSMEAISH